LYQDRKMTGKNCTTTTQLIMVHSEIMEACKNHNEMKAKPHLVHMCATYQTSRAVKQTFSNVVEN
jgi:hypothetical protein